MDKHLIVVSVDAMVYEDLEFLRMLPHIGELIANGSIVKNVTTIYPSLTHPVHATLMSGCAAGKTGIHDNEQFIPGQVSAPWNNRLEQMRCKTLFHAAHEAGMTTCACRWPMTAGGFDVIDWLIPEVMDSETAAEPNLEKLYKDICTPELYEDIVKPNLPILDNPIKYPSYEIYSLTCASEIIRKYKPNLLMTHPGMVDHNRHLSGIFSPLVTDALRMTDEWVGWLMQACKDAGIYENTGFAIVSDHGHLEWSRMVALNAILAQKGLLTVGEDGSLKDWRVYAKSTGISSQIYVRDEKDKPEVYNMLKEMAEVGLYGFTQVLTVEETKERYGLYGDFAFVVEGDGYTNFSTDWNKPFVRKANQGIGNHNSSHGHMPERGPQPPMILCGSGFKKGVVVEHSFAINEAPTFAAALGLSLPDAEGKAIAEVLE